METQIEEKKKTEKDILNSLSGYRGSETFLRDDFRGTKLTEGFREFLKSCE